MSPNVILEDSWEDETTNRNVSPIEHRDKEKEYLNLELHPETLDYQQEPQKTEIVTSDLSETPQVAEEMGSLLTTESNIRESKLEEISEI